MIYSYSKFVRPANSECNTGSLFSELYGNPEDQKDKHTSLKNFEKLAMTLSISTLLC